MKYMHVLFLLVSVSFSVYSFSPEEEANLQEKSKEELIKIVKILDNSLTQIENEYEGQKKILEDREILLNQRESDLVKREFSIETQESQLKEWNTSLTMREQMLEESWQIQAEMQKAKFWDGFKWGAAAGAAIGGGAGFAAGRL